MSMPGAIGEAIGGGGFIYITIDGRRVRQKIATWGRKIDDLSPVWEGIGGDLRWLWEQNFDLEGAALAKSRKWAQLAPSTVYDREHHGYPGAHPILVREGDLMQSVTRLYAAGNISRVYKLGAEFGTNWYTAAWQHFGTRPRGMRYGRISRGARGIADFYRSGGYGGIPARPIVGVSRDMKSNILKRLNEYTHQLATQYWQGS